jgi:hypothetical protein
MLAAHATGASLLRQLKAHEDGKLRAIERAIKDLRDRIASTSDATLLGQLRLRMTRLRRGLFAPLTSGLHYHDDTAAAMRWPVPFQEPFLTAFIITQASAAELKSMGVIARGTSRDVVTAWIPLSAIPALEASAKVRFIELARPMVQMLNDAIPFTGIGALQNAGGHTGKNVVVAIVDSCLDFRHEDFSVLEMTVIPAAPARPVAPTTPVAGFGTFAPPLPNPIAMPAPPAVVWTPKSRLLSLWDQRVVQKRSEGLLGGLASTAPVAYGAEYDGAALTNDLNGTGPTIKHEVFDEHGTLVTGCAAGNGRAFARYKTANPSDMTAAAIPALSGAAPEADIIFVAHAPVDGTVLMADSTAIQDAIAYAFDQADALGKACVVNLSDSDNQGPHDGTAAGEQFLNGLLAGPRAGRAIVLAAGNTNGTGEHASGRVAAGRTTSLELEYSGGPADPVTNPLGAPMNSDVVEIWYAGSDRFSIKVNAPTDSSNPPTMQSIVGPLPDRPDVIDTVAFTGSGALPATSVSVTIHSHTNDPRNHANMISITITVAAGGYVPIGVWTIELTGDTVAKDGSFHAWLDRNNRGYAAWRPAAGAPPPGMTSAGSVEGDCTIAVPATADLPIAVGWHDKSTPPRVDSVFESSGCGLTRDGRLKPDLIAPGRGILCQYPPALPGPAQQFPGYRRASGSSVAAPIVAGACALIFECQGIGTTAEQVKTILKKFAGTNPVDGNGNPLVPPNPTVGNGYLQMVNATGTTVCSPGVLGSPPSPG